MAARVTDWGLAALVLALVVSGALTLFAGSPGTSWVFALHDVLGAAITVLLAVKLRRVWPRVARLARWDARTFVGVLGMVLVLVTLGAGLLWADGATLHPAGYSLLSWHDAVGALLVIVVAAHMLLRAKPLRARDLARRREFLALGAVALGSLLAWRVQRPLQSLLGVGGAGRRFTGSYDAGSFTGNAFPSTSWVADRPRPIDPGSYRLRVAGLVSRRLTLALAELSAEDRLVATLDCTGGFYSTQEWAGTRLGSILDLAGADRSAGHVSVVSRTGYRWSFALDDARRLLLATHVGGQPLSHEHGAPVRLVVPDARGYQWVKWVERIELRADPDYAAPASTVWSSFTAAGSGSA